MRRIILISRCLSVEKAEDYPFCFHFKGFYGPNRISQVRCQFPEIESLEVSLQSHGVSQYVRIQPGESYLLYVVPLTVDSSKTLFCQICSVENLANLEWEY